jgi:hypothetical protein
MPISLHRCIIKVLEFHQTVSNLTHFTSWLACQCISCSPIISAAAVIVICPGISPKGRNFLFICPEARLPALALAGPEIQPIV